VLRLWHGIDLRGAAAELRGSKVGELVDLVVNTFALRGLKFSAALPEALATETITRRLGNTGGSATVLRKSLSRMIADGGPFWPWNKLGSGWNGRCARSNGVIRFASRRRARATDAALLRLAEFMDRGLSHRICGTALRSTDNSVSLVCDARGLSPVPLPLLPDRRAHL
jgi:hypothetical protein